MLKFTTEIEAMQYLSDISGSRVKIAENLKDRREKAEQFVKDIYDPYIKWLEEQ